MAGMMNTAAMKRMASRFPGVCNVCGQDIAAGAEILWDGKARVSVHADCPATLDRLAALAAPGGAVLLRVSDGREFVCADGELTMEQFGEGGAELQWARMILTRANSLADQRGRAAWFAGRNRPESPFWIAVALPQA